MNKPCLIVLFALFVLPLVNSANLGISPAKLSFKNMVRGGYAESSISIVLDSDKSIGVNAKTIGEIANWINVSQTHFNVSKDNPQSVKLMLNVPNDVANGEYVGYIRVTINSNEDIEDGHVMGKIHSNLDLKITVNVTDKEKIDCSILKTSVLSAEVGDDIILRTNLDNNGNVRISPEIIAEIWDSSQSNIIKLEKFLSNEILPTTRDSLEFKISSKDFLVGQYWIDMKVPECGGSKLLTFDILKEGSLNAKGVILSMVANPNAEVGEIVPMEIGFKNIGEKEVDAKFSGKIFRDGKVVKVLESEKSSVSPGFTETFDMYFIPEKSGEYTVSGRILYEGKRTYDKKITIVASSKLFDKRNIVYIFFIFFISFMLYKIQKEKRRYRNKIRRIK